MATAAFIPTYVSRLQKECAIEVVEAETGASVHAGCCYVAGNNLHLCPFRKLSGEVVLRRPSQPKTLFVPGVGVMMDSVLSIYGARTIGGAHDRYRGRRRRSDGQNPRGRWGHHRRVGRKLRRLRDAVSGHRAGRGGDCAAQLGNSRPAGPHPRVPDGGRFGATDTGADFGPNIFADLCPAGGRLMTPGASS